MRIVVLAAVTITALSAVPAVAQTSTGRFSPVARPGQGMDGLALAERESWRKEVTRRKQMMSDPTRKARADRAIAMINAGDCAGALQMAINEQDTDMAANIRKTCEAPPAQ